MRGFGIAGSVTFMGIVAVNAMGFIDHDTRSGMGCGANWPLCNGSVIPSFSNEAVIIEYVHRLLTLVFVSALVMFLFGAFKKHRQFGALKRLTWVLITLLLIETVICTAGVLWNVPAPIMACLAPIGLAAQGILWVMIRTPLTDPSSNARADANISARIMNLIGILSLAYLYTGAWESYISPAHPSLVAVYLVSGILLALAVLFWIGSRARTGKGRGYGLWPLVAAPFVSSFESRTVAGDLAIYIWLSWCTAVVIYYLLDPRVQEGTIEFRHRRPVPSKSPQ